MIITVILHRTGSHDILDIFLNFSLQKNLQEFIFMADLKKL